MALPNAINDREYQKFDLNESGDVVVRTTFSGTGFLIQGTDDGTTSGTKFTFVYNAKQQILASHDRFETYLYADFGTKNQRVTRIDYTSATFSGTIVRRDFNYILDGNNYRLTTSVWSVI